MSQYREILENLKNGVCNYRNEASGVSYSLGNTKMKITVTGDFKFFSTLEEMARSINKFLKTGS
jgi:hypothetical protein